MKNFIRFVALAILACFSSSLSAQNSGCDERYEAAVQKFKAGELQAAVSLYIETKDCDKDFLLKDKLERLLQDIINEVNRQKESEKVAREEAEAAKQEAQELARKETMAREDAQRSEEKTRKALEQKDKADVERVKLLLDRVHDNIQTERFDLAVLNIEEARFVNALTDSVTAAYGSLFLAALNSAHHDTERGRFHAAFEKILLADSMYLEPEPVLVEYACLEASLLNDIRRRLLNQQLDTAVALTHLYSRLTVPRDTLIDLYFEEAFCLTELQYTEAAIAVTDTLARLMDREAERNLLARATGQYAHEQLAVLRKVQRQLDPVREPHFRHKYFGFEARRIDGGVFSPGEADRKSCPVSVQPFLMSPFEVTFNEYDFYCAASGARKPSDNGWGRECRPVVDVDWFEALEYCNWRSRQEGLTEVYSITFDADANPTVTCDWSANGYRLPTEAEWEFAAGNGEAHNRFSWGNDFPAESHGGNVADETARGAFPGWKIFEGYSDAFGFTAPVGSFSANQFGVYDLSGNVWEWCWDALDDDLCRALSLAKAANKHANPVLRALRGGSWGAYPEDCAVSRRYHRKPADRNFSIGFRLVRNP